MYLSGVRVTPKLKDANHTEKWATHVPVLPWQWWRWGRCEVQNGKAKFDFILASGGLKRPRPGAGHAARGPRAFRSRWGVGSLPVQDSVTPRARTCRRVQAPALARREDRRAAFW